MGIEFSLKFFSMQETIQRYQRRIKEVQIDKTLVEQNMQVIYPMFNHMINFLFEFLRMLLT